LDAAALGAALDTAAGPWRRLDIVEVTGSTNADLIARSRDGDDIAGVVLLAEHQTAGRGRGGRSWAGVRHGQIIMSVGVATDGVHEQHWGLVPLLAGVAVVDTLSASGIRAGLKWPNDVLAGNAKLAGILVELSGEYSGPCAAVIGVGLNIRLPDSVHERAGQPVTDLAELTGGLPPDRNRAAAAVVAALTEGLLTFERHGFAAFAQEYAAHDLLRGQSLRILDPRGEYEAVGEGVDARGALRVRRADGSQVTVDSAEVSVRRSGAA
jgi:BirA family biotin operon repressor/biotin-[acetyl-CoA-carboxylase] ligase